MLEFLEQPLFVCVTSRPAYKEDDQHKVVFSPMAALKVAQLREYIAKSHVDVRPMTHGRKQRLLYFYSVRRIFRCQYACTSMPVAMHTFVLECTYVRIRLPVHIRVCWEHCMLV